MGLSIEDFLKPDFVIQLGMGPNRIDLQTGIDGVDFEDAWASRNQGLISGIKTCFISRDRLVQNKRAANRAQDLADVEVLEKTRPPVTD